VNPRAMQGEAIEDVTNAMQRAFGNPTDQGWGAVIFYTHVTPNRDMFIEGFTYPYPLESHETRVLIDNCRAYLDEMERQLDA
jgi:hypothetical protein